MVWGLVEPADFGDCFPDGQYIGWQEKLSSYFRDEMTDERRKIYDNWDVSYIEKVAQKFTANLGPLDNHEMPTKYQLNGPRKKLGSLLLLQNRLLTVEATIKDIIEKLEPKQHQFWPIEIVLGDGEKIKNKYFGMIILRFVDSFNPEKSSDYQSKLDHSIYHAEDDTKRNYSHLFIDEELSDGYHLWRENRLRSPNVLISDELQGEIYRQNLRIFKHHKLRTA